MVQIAMKDALATLDSLQRDTFGYFWHEANPTNGLIADNTTEKAPASIAAGCFSPRSPAVGGGRSFFPPTPSVGRSSKTPRFFLGSPHKQDSRLTVLKEIVYH